MAAAAVGAPDCGVDRTMNISALSLRESPHNRSTSSKVPATVAALTESNGKSAMPTMEKRTGGAASERSVQRPRRTSVEPSARAIAASGRRQEGRCVRAFVVSALRSRTEG